MTTATAPRQAYALLRLIVGVDMFLHGATRIATGVGKFADKLLPQFQNTFLPAEAVRLFGVLLPFVETLIGVLLILGWRTREALVLGSLIIAVLIFGTALRSDWNTVGLQLVYAAIYYLLLAKIADNGYALDTWRRIPD